MPPGLWWPSETSCPEALGGNLEPPKDVVVVVGEQMEGFANMIDQLAV